VDAGGELVDVQRVDHEVDDALRGFLGEYLRRVGHSPADRPQPITRIHAVSISRSGVRGNHSPGMRAARVIGGRATPSWRVGEEDGDSKADTTHYSSG